MAPRKTTPLVLSLIVGVLVAGFFVSVYGGPRTFLTLAEKVSWLQYWYGLILIIVVFWMGFVGTWAVYSVLLWVFNRHV